MQSYFPDFHEEVRETFLEFNNECFILCDDLNLSLNPTVDNTTKNN